MHKDINFPDSDLNVPLITSEDINNSDFVVKHATAAQILIAVLELPKFGILIARGD